MYKGPLVPQPDSAEKTSMASKSVTLIFCISQPLSLKIPLGQV
jgi:hypothetical protein